MREPGAQAYSLHSNDADKMSALIAPASRRYFRLRTFAVNDPFIDVSPLVRSTSPPISSADAEVTFTSPLNMLRSNQDLTSVPPLRATNPTLSTFMYLSALAE